VLLGNSLQYTQEGEKHTGNVTQKHGDNWDLLFFLAKPSCKIVTSALLSWTYRPNQVVRTSPPPHQQTPFLMKSCSSRIEHKSCCCSLVLMVHIAHKNTVSIVLHRFQVLISSPRQWIFLQFCDVVEEIIIWKTI
jgi:hypothetical protein